MKQHEIVANSKTRIACLLVLTPALLAACTAHAQFPTTDTFNPGADGSVNALAVQTDGKILVAGWFDKLGGQWRKCLGRLNGNGTLDTGFNPQPGGTSPNVNCLAIQSDSKILVGGQFTSLNGQQRSFIGRLNPDGTLDSGFNPGANAQVFMVMQQADGKIVVAGAFSALGGQPRPGLGRLNPDGTLDFGFNPPLVAGYPKTLAIQADGKILAGPNMLSGPYLCRLNADGTLDSAFDPAANGWVDVLAVQPDGKILVAGQFTMLGGQARNKIGRLNPDGTLDSSFNPGTDQVVNSLVMQADGKILVAGSIRVLGGQARNSIGRLNPDGTLDSEFNAGTKAYSEICSLAVQPDGKIIVGGRFKSLGGQSRTNLGRLNSTGAATQDLGYADPAITWFRGGASPEVWRTTFEISTNGLTFSNVGDGSRGAGGWQLTGISFPPSSTIRARGYIPGGHRNASGGWFTETFGGGPFLVTSPSSQVREVGTTASFSAFAVGSQPLNYQWRFYGTNIPLQTGNDLILPAIRTNQAGPYDVVVSNVYGSVTSSVASLTVMSLGDALDAPQLLWVWGGSTNWIVQATNTYDGVDAAQSGDISHGQETWLETSVVGPGLLSFWWMVSSESYSDYLEFYTNGVRVVRISGALDWQMQIHTLQAGTNALRWRYTKDSYGSSGQDRGWLDHVVFAAQSGPPVIAIQPTNQSVEAGGTCMFAVTAGGTLPLTYQWQFLGANLLGQTSTNLVLSGVTTNQTGAYTVVVTNALGSVTSAVARLTVIPVLTLGEALEAPELVWTGGGSALWKPQTTTTHDGVDAAQSGPISHSQETWMQSSVVGPGQLSFWWKVSSESGYDFLEFYTNNVRVTRISGEVAWQQLNYTLGAGTHVLRWRYMKDSSASSGQDRGWVDQVSFVPATARPSIIVNDGSFGIRSNRFGFNVSGTAGQVVIVEGSTNLSIWQPLQTNTLGGSPVYFSDPATAAFPWRFYRARVGP